MSDIDETIADLRRKLEAATPGPWSEEYCQSAVRHLSKNVDTEWFYEGEFSGWGRHNDGPLIAAAVNALPSLLDEIERLRREQERSGK